MGRTESVLSRLGIEYKAYKAGYTAKCPNPAHNDRNPSWSIRADGLHSCWSCGFRGDLFGLVIAVLGCSFIAAKAFAGDEDARAPDAVLPIEVHIVYKNGLQVPEGVEFPDVGEWPFSVENYLDRRGITQAQATKWGLGYAKSGELKGRIFIPYFNRYGEMLSFTARSYIGETPKYKKPSPAHNPDKTAMFGEQYWSGKRDFVIVTEGELNALAVDRVSRHPVAALSGSRISPIFAAKLASFKTIISMTDSDDAGDKASALLSDSMARHSKVVRARLPDGQDCNDVSPELLRATISRAILAA